MIAIQRQSFQQSTPVNRATNIYYTYELMYRTAAKIMHTKETGMHVHLSKEINYIVTL